MGKIRLAGIIRESIVDGPGLRFVVFTQGCPHNCPGCHNPETHDFAGGTECDADKLYDMIIKTPMIKGVTVSGGEPFCQAQELASFCERLRKNGYHIMCYSGYTFEELTSKKDESVSRLLENCDLLVDGRFIMAQRDLTLNFRGSKNQRIIDVPKSLAENRAVLSQYNAEISR